MRRALCVLTAMLILWTATAGAFSIPSETAVIEAEAFLAVPVTELVIPDGVTAIDARAFSTASLRHVTIPASVTAIDAAAFDGAASGFFATVAEGSYAETWCRAHGIAYSYTDTLYVTPAVTALSVSLQGPKYLGVPYSVLDCQAFVEVCLQDAGLYVNLAGSNAWYRAMDWVGTPEECVAQFGSIPKGAFLFILDHDGGEPDKYKADGLGNASHIGLYTGVYTGGQVGAMASSYSRGCVIYSKFYSKTISGGWNRVGLWKQLDYGEDINRWLQSH